MILKIDLQGIRVTIENQTLQRTECIISYYKNVDHKMPIAAELN